MQKKKLINIALNRKTPLDIIKILNIINTFERYIVQIISDESFEMIQWFINYKSSQTFFSTQILDFKHHDGVIYFLIDDDSNFLKKNQDLLPAKCLIFSRNIFLPFFQLTCKLTNNDKYRYIRNIFSETQSKHLKPFIPIHNTSQLIKKIQNKQFLYSPLLSREESLIVFVLTTKKRFVDIYENICKIDKFFQNKTYIQLILNDLIQNGIVKKHKNCYKLLMSNENIQKTCKSVGFVYVY
ncbi:hypothetical protein EDEG_00054 [Edhazardia aedis USNM 41457]|uniref:Uncharacterized protein n=1 Tax=Edhazardia aedis (strain USNM 41457) TaxID=1003232 RepID=J9DS37_EDHAE|nr:hypothetical protein EDEG_00054 [Edhazardia aedis USNM 41457]|eukprot:EJW05390.1 hypothetical protein EDEG_00054 [Edhazardia aedis USNM 41457]